MKPYGGRQVQLSEFITSTLDGGVWSASSPGHFTLREKAPGTHLIRNIHTLATLRDDPEGRGL
jgi:hypothetical protein